MLSLNDTNLTAVEKLSQGNPGALQVCCELFKAHGFGPLLDMDDMGIAGQSVWLGYKNFAGEDLDTFATALRERDQKMIDAIKAAGGQAWRGGRS
jgi:hypothetical protein